MRHSIGNRQSVHSAVQCVALCVCKFIAAYWLRPYMYSDLIGQKMQITGCRNGNEMRTLSNSGVSLSQRRIPVGESKCILQPPTFLQARTYLRPT